ncbi:MAG: hypothetical protein WB493_03640 [Anaeromyxobacteraceae bacterium]
MHGIRANASAAARLAFGLVVATGLARGARAAEPPPRTPATIRVTAPGPILADGSGRGGLELVEVFVLDAAGEPVDETPVGSSERGEFREAIRVAPGHWALPYQPPLVLSDTTEMALVRAGGTSAKVELSLVVRQLKFPLGMKAGVAAAGGNVGPAVGVEVGVFTFSGPLQLGLVLEVGWWMLSRSSTESIGGVDTAYRGTQNYFPLLLSVGLRVPLADTWFVWLTAGGGGALVSSQVNLAGLSTASETGLAPAASGAISAGPRIGPGFLFLEGRATWIGDAGLSTVSGSTLQFLGFVGYRFDVG